MSHISDKLVLFSDTYKYCKCDNLKKFLIKTNEIIQKEFNFNRMLMLNLNRNSVTENEY